jgi:dihydroneopterin aldolase/2-amino-4-hydroxy-6-hydroxymethyldihydropteridine diphosphokinase/dihydropteroate synthase
MHSAGESVGDTIRVNDLLLTIRLATGAHWPQTRGAVEQPVLVSLAIPHDVRQTAWTDHLGHSVNYSTLSKTLRHSLELKNTFDSLEAFAVHIFDTLLSTESEASESPIHELRVKIIQLKPPLHVKLTRLEAVATVVQHGSWSVSHIKHFIEDLECHTIIGVNPHERDEKQVVKLNISIEECFQDLSKENWVDFRGLTRALYEVRLHASNVHESHNHGAFL